MKSTIAAALVLSAIPVVASPIQLTGSTYLEDFNSLANTGLSSTIPGGWAFAESGTSGNQTYGSTAGSSTTGNTYSFGNSSDRALGGLQSASLIPTFGAEFQNATGWTVTSLNLRFTGEQWRLGKLDRIDRLDFQYSLNASSLSDGTWVNVDLLDFDSPVSTGTVGARDGNLSENQSIISHSITGLTIAANDRFWIRWVDFAAEGADDGLAIDDFSLTPVFAQAVPNAVPDALPFSCTASSLLGLLAWAKRRKP